MGSLLGHVVPGTFFSAFSLWWLYNILYRFFYCRRFRPNEYRNTSQFPCPCNKSRRIPVESGLKVIAVIIGMLGEFFTGFEEGKFTHWGNAQHMTMFFFFGLNGTVDLLLYKRWLLPPKLDYVTAALAFGVEGFLFYNHLHGRPHMDIQVHMFLFYLIVACVVSTLAEMFQPKEVIPALCRSFFTLLQGTWFFQVGLILYPLPGMEKWDQDDHMQMMKVTMIFTWHVAAIFVFMIFMGMFVYSRVQSSSSMNYPLYQILETDDHDPLSSDTNKDGAYHEEVTVETVPRKFTNGHLPFGKNGESINHILDSDSEEA